MTLEVAKASIRPCQSVWFWVGKGKEGAQYKQAKVIKKYEYHFMVKHGNVRECFTYTDVMTGDVQIRG